MGGASEGAIGGGCFRRAARCDWLVHCGQYALVPVWPLTREELIEEQARLAALGPGAWRFELDAQIGGAFVCFVRGGSGPGRAGDPAWAAACVGRDTTVVAASAGAPYEPGLLAREGALLKAAVRALPELPDALLVDATGRDHPRRAGLAFQIGAVLELPTVGVTHRPLLAQGEWPADERGARTPLLLGGELVGYWLRTKAGTRPLAVHAAWRTDPDTAADVVLSASRARTPEPLRRARRRAREARAMGSSDDWARKEGAMADVTRFLEQAGIDFDLLEHAPTVRATDEATALGIGPEEVAKTLVLVASSGNVRAVLAAPERIDLHKVASALGIGGKKVQLASEETLARDYPDFELGAVPPFGGREDHVLVDERLAGRDSVVVEAGSHDRSVRLKVADLVRLTRAQVADICREEPTAR